MSVKFRRLAVGALCVVGLGGSGCAAALAQTGSSGPAPRGTASTTTTDTTTTDTTTTGATTTGTTTTGTTTTGTTTTGTTTTATTTSSTTTAGVILDPVTQAPTAVRPTSAVLNGTVDTDGQAGSYSFEYDTVSDYTGAQSDLSATTATFISAGSTSLTSVSAEIGCYPVASCTADGATPLKPDTKYEYILQYDTGAGTSAANQYSSTEGTFTTDKYGLIKPSSKTLSFSGKKLSLPLTCSSVEKCAGTAVVRHNSTKCGSSKFTIGSGDSKTVRMTLASKCVSEAKKARGGRLSAKLAISPTTGQPSVAAKLTLVDTKA